MIIEALLFLKITAMGLGIEQANINSIAKFRTIFQTYFVMSFA